MNGRQGCELDHDLLDPRNVKDSNKQHAVSSLPQQLNELKVAKP